MKFALGQAVPRTEILASLPVAAVCRRLRTARLAHAYVLRSPHAHAAHPFDRHPRGAAGRPGSLPC